MKQEHSKLSQEAHECASAIPDLNKMLIGVETLGKSTKFSTSRYFITTLFVTNFHLQLLSVRTLKASMARS